MGLQAGTAKISVSLGNCIGTGLLRENQRPRGVHDPVRNVERRGKAFYDHIRNKDYGLSPEIPADKRTINQFRRFTGRAEGLSISFEQHLLGSKVEFDQPGGTLILRGLPTQLVDQLKRATM